MYHVPKHVVCVTQTLFAHYIPLGSVTTQISVTTHWLTHLFNLLV